MKLKIDVQQSTIDGLTSEVRHSTIELKETKDLLHIYETKCEELIRQLTTANAELNGNKREMISFTQTKEEKDFKIDQLKTDLRAAQMSSDDYKMKLGTLNIHSDKQKEQISALQQSYDDAVEKLHKMNKARHDLETKMTDEIERNRSL